MTINRQGSSPALTDSLGGSRTSPATLFVERPKEPILKRAWKARVIYLMLLPTFGLITLFNYFPVILGFYYSFTIYDGMTSYWTGLTNYRRIFQDPALVQSYKNMAIILPFTIIIGVVMPLLVAYLIYHLMHSNTRYIFRVMFTLPMVVPGIVMLLIWIYIYTPGGGLNTILDMVGLKSWTLVSGSLERAWLGDPNTALAAVLFAGFPWVSPVNMLIFLAGLENINVELVDAAKVDGAIGWKMFQYLELPMVVGQIRLVVVTSTIGVMQGFQNILVMTGGGPGYATMVPAMRMYDTVFGANPGGQGTAPQMGFGSAIGVFLFLIIMVITIFNLRVIRSRVEQVAA